MNGLLSGLSHPWHDVTATFRLTAASSLIIVLVLLTIVHQLETRAGIDRSAELQTAYRDMITTAEAAASLGDRDPELSQRFERLHGIARHEQSETDV